MLVGCPLLGPLPIKNRLLLLSVLADVFDLLAFQLQL
jgi:hypothetical protein